jgi:hypothetical protein
MPSTHCSDTFMKVQLAATAAGFAAIARNEPHMDVDHHPLGEQPYLEVLHQLQSAIETLDRLDVPGQIAAHVDLAMHQLQDLIDAGIAGPRLDQIERNAAPQ